jgi:iron complex transport system permease protein
LAWNIRYGDWVLRLVLAGIVSSALFSSGVGILKYMADPLSELPDIVFWLMGGLWAISWREVFYVVPVIAVSMVILFMMRWRLNLLALRDDTAFSLGAAPARERALVLVASVAATAVVVAVAGVVSWVGLIVPHIARRLVGADAQRVLPASMLIGGVFALLCDNLARTLRAGEIPLGIITSLLGALVFMVMFFRNSTGVRKR